MQVRLGEYDFDEASQVRRDYSIENIYEHPQFVNNGSLPNDIAIVELTQPVAFSRFISAICLPTAGDNLPLEGDNLIVAGWGRTTSDSPESRILLQVELNVKKLADCQSAYRFINANITNQQLCAGDQRGDSCFVRRPSDPDNVFNNFV